MIDVGSCWVPDDLEVEDGDAVRCSELCLFKAFSLNAFLILHDSDSTFSVHNDAICIQCRVSRESNLQHQECSRKVFIEKSTEKPQL